MIKKTVMASTMELIKDYHIHTCVFWLSKINDPKYGFISQFYVYFHNHTPIQLGTKA